MAEGKMEGSTGDKKPEVKVSLTTNQQQEGDETITLEELEEQLKAAHSETAEAQEQISALTQQLATSVPRAEAMMARRDLEKRIDMLTKDNQALTDEVEKEQKEREWLEGELRAQYEAAEGTDQEMLNLQTFVRKLHTLVEDKTKILDTQKEEREGMVRQLEDGKEELGRLRKEVESRSRILARVEASYKDVSSVVKLREEDLVRVQKEATAAKRQYDQLEKSVRHQEQRRADIETQATNLRGQLKAIINTVFTAYLTSNPFASQVMEKQAVTEGRQRQRAVRQADKLKREKDVLHRNYVKTQGMVQKHAGLVHIWEVERQASERELSKAHRDITKQASLVKGLQHVRDRQVEETNRVEGKVLELAGELEAQAREVQQVIHSQAMTETQLEQANTLLDGLNTDNFILTRQLRNVKTEKEEAAEECRKANYLVEKLRQNLNSRDQDLQRLAAEATGLEREVDQVRAAEQAARRVAQERQRAVEYTEGEKLGLSRLLHLHYNVEEMVKKELEEERQRRGVVTTQLARRNDEVQALRERVRLLEHILHKGDKDYSNRMQDVSTLTNEVNALRDERQVLGRHVRLVEALKVELVRLQRELIASQNKRASLEAELIQREKCHRWTTLKASDPSKYDLLRKNQLLQKRLVAATQRVAAIEGEVGHKEREVEELRRAMERSAGQQHLAASRSHLVHQLRAKDDQIKSVTAALNAAVLAQEETEQERRHLRQKLAATTQRLNVLQRKQQRRQSAPVSQQQQELGGGDKGSGTRATGETETTNGWIPTTQNT
ncbi:hypothetical protein Pcinc_013179 [Petrolisthes cinctipes]|uniref:Cilia- and flagella-associated protein 58 central coiled coil domain-containing protein n=1 Tax=Petrolisthes cinctipes TaxID=88211 RepID=A0AAE1KRU8_PETCI|nr:hypothetical protein Pcinc_013179 [Petrolisthes cinctipes]